MIQSDLEALLELLAVSKSKVTPRIKDKIDSIETQAKVQIDSIALSIDDENKIENLLTNSIHKDFKKLGLKSKLVRAREKYES